MQTFYGVTTTSERLLNVFHNGYQSFIPLQKLLYIQNKFLATPLLHEIIKYTLSYSTGAIKAFEKYRCKQIHSNLEGF